MFYEQLPQEVYHDEPHVRALQDALETEYRKAREIYDDLILQMRPSTASWGLRLYEREYGIEPDATRSTTDRLAVWRAKRRGRGVTTSEVIRNIAQSFSKEPVRVVECPEEYRFSIFLDASAAKLQNALTRAIEEAKPAHLAFGVSLHLRMPESALRAGARCTMGTRIAVHPYKVEGLNAYAQAKGGTHWKWGHRLSVQPGREQE